VYTVWETLNSIRSVVFNTIKSKAFMHMGNHISCQMMTAVILMRLTRARVLFYYPCIMLEMLFNIRGSIFIKSI